MDKYLAETALLNFKSAAISDLIEEKKWRELDGYNKILSVYNFVRDDITFGYNEDDNLAADRIFADGYGQCNTKSILFMALLRGVGIPCRLHGFLIDKKVQYGLIKGIYYRLMPNELFHTWAEVFFDNTWHSMEGIILDLQYLKQMQGKNKECNGGFCGYGIGTEDLKNLKVEWRGSDTFIQRTAITKDLGAFDSPDEFFSKHSQALSPLKKWLFRNHVRHSMNKNVKRIRDDA